jgi:hypothetical protein
MPPHASMGSGRRGTLVVNVASESGTKESYPPSGG